MSVGTQMILRLAADLVVDGATHPVAAALARGARMRTLAGPAAFAAMLGIDELTVRRAEGGLTDVDSLPAAYLSHLDGLEPRLDLVGLRHLALQADGERVDDQLERPDYGSADVIDLAEVRAARCRADRQRVC